MKRTLITNIGMLATPQGTSARGGRAQGEICILKKGVPVFRGTVARAKAQCGCERFEDAYLQLSSEEADA